MSEIPENLYYSQYHQWIKINEDEETVTVGLTGYAQEFLGDIVFIESPEIDADVEEDQACGVIESVKTAADIFAPLAGKILDTNPDLMSDPELINSDPYEGGWLFTMQPEEIENCEELMSSNSYEQFLESEEEEEEDYQGLSCCAFSKFERSIRYKALDINSRQLMQ